MSAMLLDIEGTLSSQCHVAGALWAHSRTHLAGFVAARGGEPEVAEVLRRTVALAGGGEPVAILTQWIDEDRKAPPLKAMQGLMWSAGFADGSLRGHIFPDALASLRRWHARGVSRWVFSSGTVRTQREFFAHTDHGDVTALFSGHFDTAMGAKVEADSYRRIAAAIGVAPEGVTFLSDNPRELDAAAEAGLRVRQVVREDTVPDARFDPVSSFDDVATP